MFLRIIILGIRSCKSLAERHFRTWSIASYPAAPRGISPAPVSCRISTNVSQPPPSIPNQTAARRVLCFGPAAPGPDGEKPNVSDPPRDPLAALRVPPTPAQVLEHIHEEAGGLISFAALADMPAVARLLERAREEAEKLLADRGSR
jgi:hypothetical protein